MKAISGIPTAHLQLMMMVLLSLVFRVPHVMKTSEVLEDDN